MGKAGGGGRGGGVGVPYVRTSHSCATPINGARMRFPPYTQHWWRAGIFWEELDEHGVERVECGSPWARFGTHTRSEP